MQLSFGMVFRIWTMAAFLIGWLVLTQRALPETVFLGVMCSGIVLSWAVGLRRLGSLWPRVWASVSFVLCTLSVAFYSALFAAWQKPTCRHLS